MNLKSFKLKNTVDKYRVFEGISSNVKYCIDDIETKNFLGINSDCSDDFFKENKKTDNNNNVALT